MASSNTLDYFFYNIGATHFVESVSDAGVQTAMGTAFMTGSGSITDPRIDTRNGRVVVSCVRGGYVRVMEFDNPCTVTVENTFAGCEQTLTTAPTVSLIVSDNNYIHTNLSVTAASTNAAVVPNVNVAMVGSYPNYYLQFTSLDIAADENVEFEFETIENGVYTNYELFYADVIANPTATITYTNNEVCENEGIVNLIPHGSPAGGFWTGPGVTTINSKFNPDVANPGTHTINYTYFNSYGCYDTESASVIVHPVPNVTVTTTPANCGVEDGTANATITGGTPAYTIYWSNGSSLEDQSDLAAGVYYINVTDSEGCGVTKPATVSSNGLTLSGTVTDVLCAGANTGSIDLTATTTAGVASIAWSNGQVTEDVTGLPAGTYEVTVTDNSNCVSTSSFTVLSPAPLTFTGSTTDATCGGFGDGSATCNVSRWNGPYDFQWFHTASGTPNGTNNATLSSVFSGAYYAIVTDANGCSGIYNTVISDAGAPTVSFTEITPAGCTDDGAINISINSTAPISGVLWSNGQTTEDITGLAPGFYTIEVFDMNSCTGVGVEVPAASPDLNPICLVTVDTSTNTNLLVWEKPITTDIDYFNIYRETSVAGEFQFVASVPYADESVYNDLVASPSVRSWRYKLSAVNLCGEESDLSEFHKTIHLTISFGLGNTINLNWDNYEGFTFPTFNLYRHTTAGGWNLIQSLPSTQFSYTDSPSSINGLDYIITIVPPATCTSTKAQDHNSTRSNKTASITGELVGVNEFDETGMTSVYPNPSNGEFNLFVNTENAAGFDVIVTDAQGRTVLQFSSLDANAIIDLSAFSDGVYNLQILVEDQIINRKLVKQ
ncbi:MAG: T9SS type A sorting domain-containing protein [Crocinitomicaceae bacterium]|nr:T9SS type A sorting domain-containing protein [Crocinitomicaceae bacterium]